MTVGSSTGAVTGDRAAGDARSPLVLGGRPARPSLDPLAHQGVLVEPERAADGTVVTTATVFLTGRECAWRCVMCDLWRHTTASDTPLGAIPLQIAAAVNGLRIAGVSPPVIKLYNASSFFDRRAVPPADDRAIVAALRPFSRVVVESHPALVGARTWRMRDALAAGPAAVTLEVAMGLETVHGPALVGINKGMSVDDFARAAEALAAHGVGLRVFLLVHPPFIPVAERDDWLARSVAFAFACGATAVSLIPVRPGEGGLQALAEAGLFTPPRLLDVERAITTALTHAHGRVFVDTWDLERLATCAHCAAARRARLMQLNLEQVIPAAIACEACSEATPS